MKEFDSLTCPLDQINLVEAAAGTGKTYSILNLVLRLLLERELNIENIAIVTFTEAAADELRSRLRGVISSCIQAAEGQIPDKQAAAILEAVKDKVAPRRIISKLKCANLDFDRAMIGTIHGFCRRLLTDFAFEQKNSFQLEFLSSGSDLQKQFAADTFRSICYSGPFSKLYSAMLSSGTVEYWTAKKAQRPDLEFRPAPPQNISKETLAQELMQYWEQVKKIESPETIIRQLTGLIDQRSLPPLLRTIAKITQSQYPDKDIFDSLDKLDPESIAAKAKKGCQEQMEQILRNPLFEQIQKIRITGNQLYAVLREESSSLSIQRYQDFKRRHNMLTYDDMLTKVRDSLQDPLFVAAVQTQFHVGIVDEFQDTDPVQWEIFRSLFGSHSLFLVGDPRQAIYAFRGGDIATYLAAKETVPPERRYTLTTNYRSCRGLLDQVNFWFGNHACGFAMREIQLPVIREPEEAEDQTPPLLIDGDPDDKPLKWINTDHQDKAAVTADLIQELLTDERLAIPEKEKNQAGETVWKKTPVTPDKIAVLVRGWKTAWEIRDELTLRKIPCIILSTDNVFKSPVAAELQLILEGIININDPSAVRKALLSPLCGITPGDIIEANLKQSIPEEGLNKIIKLKQSWEKYSFYTMFRQFLLAFDVEKRLAACTDGLRLLTNLIQLGDLLHHESIRRKLPPQGVLDFLLINRTQIKEDQFPQEQECDSGAVIIRTEHSSKGLQYPIAILPDIDNAGSPSDIYHLNGKLLCGREHEEDILYARDEMLQEELRLAYVAMTRAKHACFILSKPPDNKLSPMNWLWYERNVELGDDEFASERLRNGNPEVTEELMALSYPLPEPEKTYSKPQSDCCLEAREIMFFTPETSTVTSFTALAPAHKNNPLSIHDEEEKDDENDSSVPEENPENPLKRLAGTSFGTMLHNIMEKIDFSAPYPEVCNVVKQMLRLPDPTGEELRYCCDLIRNTLNLPLFSDFCIKDIPPDKNMREMKFHISFDDGITKGTLRELAANYAGRAAAIAEDNSEHMAGGFVTGSIDMVFEHDEKFYILDWKSNKLERYTQDALAESVADSFYQLQYLIYLTAFIRYLKQRLRLEHFGKAEYDRYIGGVFYIYMRGAENNAGVFFDRPEFEQLRKFAGVLK